MRFSPDYAVFYSDNETEIVRMATSLGVKLGYSGTIEDLVQDLNVRMLQFHGLKRYSPKRGKISTYVYQVLSNIIRDKNEWDQRHQCIHMGVMPDNMDELDIMVNDSTLDRNYLPIVQRNRDSGPLDSLAADLRDFARHFKKSKFNRHRSFSKRKNQAIKSRGASPLDIFIQLYCGYSSSDLAHRYGVTDMNMCHMRTLVREALRRYGIGPT
jgi:RNA polymerase sigma factor (sigma-70 family)